MFRRPNPKETDEDLLKQQEEFLKQSGKSDVSKANAKNVNEQESMEFVVPMVIKEKELSMHFAPSILHKEDQNKGFPVTFKVGIGNVSRAERHRGKKSLFAMEMEKNKKKIKMNSLGSFEKRQVKSLLKNEMPNNTQMLDSDGFNNLKKMIHNENIMTLGKMSEAEILNEQQKLLNTLDPSLIGFLKNKSSKTKSYVSNVDPSSNEMRDSVKSDLIKKQIEQYIDSKWVNMDLLENEKLEWIGDIPDKKSLEPDQPYSARFDFRGELQPFATDIDVRTSLYHHGDEPERPGYTIQELYQLSRSQVLQQRIFALNTIACIIRKTKLGFYDKCFDGQLLHKLVESDLFFLLRFSIDENALVPSSIFCMYYLLCNEPDEYCLDRLLGVTYKDDQPLLSNIVEETKENETELKDHVLISYDLIKGVLRTDLLVRLAYVLNNCSPTKETFSRTVNCLTRIVRHSVDATKKVFDTENLLQVIYKKIESLASFYEGVKLFRVMASQSLEVAQSIMQQYDFRFLVCFVEAEECQGVSKKEFYLLKLEALYFWRALLIHDLLVDEFILWSPCLIRLLLFYTQKVDINAENDFDFELFSAITSLIIVCIRKKLILDKNVMSMMKICLEKWLTQLIQSCQYNFAISKAIGCIFRYFSSYFKFFGVDTSNLEFIIKINSLLTDLLQSRIFVEMSSSLEIFSYVLKSSLVTRDPDNLPSLCSVYNEGAEFLKIVQSRSSLPFFISLVKYFKTVAFVYQNTYSLVKDFIEHPAIQRYLNKVEGSQNCYYNWFLKYETMFLTNIVQLMAKLKIDQFINLGFRVIPLLRIDDKRAKKVMEVILNKNNWSSSDNFFENLGSSYSETLLQTSTLHYKNDLVPVEWMYKILLLLREKNDVKAAISVLKFLSFLLEKNPSILQTVSPTCKYYYLCNVFLTDSYVFDTEIQNLMELVFRDIIANYRNINLNLKINKTKSFYDLFTELITQYAGVSYGLPIFAKFVLFPLQNNQNISFRKLVWFEYSHVLRVITIQYPADSFIDIKAFIEPCETDESLLVAYISSTSSGVITKKRNSFIYNIAVGNLNKFFHLKNQDEKLLNYLKKKVDGLKSQELKDDILNFSS